jgi:hypothetical protein
MSAILQLKWAREGVSGNYDKALMVWYGAYNFTFGVGYWRQGWYLPLIPMWGIPGLVWLSQF